MSRYPEGQRVRLAPGVEAVPMLHGRMEFAACVRQALLEDPPDAVTVELPATLEGLYRRAVGHLPVLTVLVFPWEDGRPAFVVVSPHDALAEAVRTADELGLPVHFVDQDVDGYPSHLDSYPDPYVVTRLGLGQYAARVEGLGVRGPLDAAREQTMVHQLQRLAAGGARLLHVGGVFHLPALRAGLAGPPVPRPLARVRRRSGVVYALAEETVRTLLCLGEAPHLAAAYEVSRAAGAPPPDRLVQQGHLLRLARERYGQEAGESVSPQELRVLARYARNLAYLSGGMVPDLLQLVTAARGAVDDNFGHAVLELATTYPFKDHGGRLPVRNLTREELEWTWTRAVRLHPHLQRPRPRPSSLPFQRRRQERRKGEWKRRFERGRSGQCSYPPEDLVIEATGRRLQERARSLLTEARARTLPFTTSMLDGVDLRETLRNWHEGRLYVRDAGRTQGAVGSVVVVFDDSEEAATRYPWEMTWWGEHDQESDMAFYATRPEEHVTGPGVARCEYGAFLMTYPPGQLPDVWTDPYYQSAQSRVERLVMAAIEFTREDSVAYVAARPPRSRWRALARRFGKQLVYLPMGALAPAQRRRVRVFHVLAGHEVRGVAAEYIW